MTDDRDRGDELDAFAVDVPVDDQQMTWGEFRDAQGKCFQN